MVIKAQFYHTHVMRVEEKTASISTLFFEVPADYPHFYPGHLVYVKPLEGQEPLVIPSKPYCICSLYEDGKIELCVDQVNTLGMSGHLTHATEGERVQISIPSGHFNVPEVVDKPLLLVGLGSGIGVMRGMMRQANRQSPAPAIQFYAVNTDETAIPFEADLEAASERFPNIQVYPILQTNGFDTAEISDRILSHAENLQDMEIYMAGPADPLQELKKTLGQLGAHARQFHVEGYA